MAIELVFRSTLFGVKIVIFHRKALVLSFKMESTLRQRASNETIFDVFDYVEYFSKFYSVSNKRPENSPKCLTVKIHNAKFFILHVQNISFDFRIVKCERYCSMPAGKWMPRAETYKKCGLNY